MFIPLQGATVSQQVCSGCPALASNSHFAKIQRLVFANEKGSRFLFLNRRYSNSLRLFRWENFHLANFPFYYLPPPHQEVKEASQ